MHVNLEIWEVLFASALFFLLIKTLYSIVKDFVIPYLTAQLHAIMKEQSELFDKEKLVSSALSKIDNQRKQQDNMFVLLEKKVQTWYDKKILSLQQEQAGARVLADKIEKKRLIQEKNFIASKIMQEALPRIIKNAEQQLSRNYGEKLIAFSPCISRFVQRGKFGGSND